MCFLTILNRRLFLKGKGSYKKKEESGLGLSDSLEKLYLELSNKARMQVEFFCKQKSHCNQHTHTHTQKG